LHIVPRNRTGKRTGENPACGGRTRLRGSPVEGNDADLPAKHKSIAVALHFSWGRETEYRILAIKDWCLWSARPKLEARTWRAYYSLTREAADDPRSVGTFPAMGLAGWRRAAEVIEVVERGRDPWPMSVHKAACSRCPDLHRPYRGPP
jgi:hypothetical protein